MKLHVSEILANKRPLADNLQVLGGLVLMAFGAYELGGWPLTLILLGVVSWADIRLDDLCAAIMGDDNEHKL